MAASVPSNVLSHEDTAVNTRDKYLHLHGAWILARRKGWRRKVEANRQVKYITCWRAMQDIEKKKTRMSIKNVGKRCKC